METKSPSNQVVITCQDTKYRSRCRFRFFPLFFFPLPIPFPVSITPHLHFFSPHFFPLFPYLALFLHLLVFFQLPFLSHHSFIHLFIHSFIYSFIHLSLCLHFSALHLPPFLHLLLPPSPYSPIFLLSPNFFIILIFSFPPIIHPVPIFPLPPFLPLPPPYLPPPYPHLTCQSSDWKPFLGVFLGQVNIFQSVANLLIMSDR